MSINRCRIFIFFTYTFVIITCAQVVNAQMPEGSNDTIQHRMLTIALPDSSLVRYEIGQVRVISSGTYHFLKFIDSSGSPDTNYLVTVPFMVGSSNDSIRVSRFAMFDDSHLRKGASGLDSVQADSVADSMYSYYINKQFSPISTFFSPSSSINFIVKLFRNSDDAILQRLDTIRCYLNSDGHLRYTASGSGSNWLKRPILTDSGTIVYLKVEPDLNLPLGTTCTYFGNMAPNQRQEPTTTGFAPTCEDMGSWSMKIATGLPHNIRHLDLSITQFYPNPTSNVLHLGLQSDASGTVKIQIITSSGKEVYSVVSNVQGGFTYKTIELNSLPSGAYIVIIADDIDSVIHNLIIEK